MFDTLGLKSMLVLFLILSVTLCQVNFWIVTGSTQLDAAMSPLDRCASIASAEDAREPAGGSTAAASGYVGVAQAMPGLAPKHVQIDDAIWNLETKLARGRVQCMAINEQGDSLAIGSSDGNVRTYSIPNMEFRGIFPGDQTGFGVECLAFSPDGRKIAILNKIRILVNDKDPQDVKDLLALRVWSDNQLLMEEIIETGHGRWTNALVWPASSEKLVAIFKRQSYVFAATGAGASAGWGLVASAHHAVDSRVLASCYSSSLKTIVTFTSERRGDLWEPALRLRSDSEMLQPGELVALPKGTGAPRLTLSPTGKRIAFQSESNGGISVFDLELRRTIYSSPIKSEFISAAWGEHDDSLFVYLRQKIEGSPGVFTAILGEIDLRTTRTGISANLWTAVRFDAEFAPLVFDPKLGIVIGDSELRQLTGGRMRSLLAFERLIGPVVARPGDHCNVGMLIDNNFAVFDCQGREHWRQRASMIDGVPWSSDGSRLFVSGRLYEHHKKGSPQPYEFRGTRSSGLLSPDARYIGHVSEGKASIYPMKKNIAIVEVDQLSSLVGSQKILGRYYPAAAWHPTEGSFYVCDGTQVVRWTPGTDYFRRVSLTQLPTLSAGFQLRWFGSGQRLIIGDNIYSLGDDGSLEMLETKLAGGAGLKGRALATKTDAHVLYQFEPGSGPLLAVYASVDAQKPAIEIKLPKSVGTVFPRLTFMNNDTKIVVSDLSSAWIIDASSGALLTRIVLLSGNESIGIDGAGRVAAQTSEKALQQLVFYGISANRAFSVVDKVGELPVSAAMAFEIPRPD